MKIDIWEYHSKKQIKQIYKELSKDLIKNNSSYFHYTDYQLNSYLDNPKLDQKQRFQQFYLSWSNLQNKHRIIDRFFFKNKVIYPKLFEKKKRHIIKKITINYKLILQQINNYKIKKQQIPYGYQILVKKLIKIILLNQVYKTQNVNVFDIDLKSNTVQIQIDQKLKKYKINKLLQKYQKLFPQKYEICKAYLVISADWHDLFLQSTFKQWTSCVNLLTRSVDNTITYSTTNGIKAGNLIAYCILDLEDGKTIDQIMDDNGCDGLMYERCFWRCSIKRYVDKTNYLNYIFCAQNISYGTIIQNAITYHNNLFIELNNWLTLLNQKLIHKTNNMFTIYKLPYNLYSDLHTYNQLAKNYCFEYFNISKLKQIKSLTKKQKQKLQFKCFRTEKLFTNDIIDLLSVFHHFQQNQQAQQYIKNNTQIDYVQNIYFKDSHFILNNIKSTKKILNTIKVN